MPRPTSPEHGKALKELQDNNPTHETLVELRKKMPTLDKDQRAAINAALTAFEERSTHLLEHNELIQEGLLKLKQSLADAEQGIGRAQRTMMDAGTVAQKEVNRTVSNAAILGYNEWTHMMDPNNSTQSKIMRGLGLAAVGYGAHRAARWAWGKSGSSWLGRFFKFTGVTALAGFTINHLGEKTTKKKASPEKKVHSYDQDPPASPTKKPKAVKLKEGEDPFEETPQNESLLKGIPMGEDLMRKPLKIQLNGEHTITFQNDSFMLDGSTYKMKKMGWPITLLHITSDGQNLSVGYGKNETANASEKQLHTMLTSLLEKQKYSAGFGLLQIYKDDK